MGHRALIYLKEYTLSRPAGGDGIVAATAAESNRALVTSSPRYFKPTKELKLKVFNP
jgi:predicted nucleic acid-binding protein